MMYPFSALVAQQKLKQALLLCAVNPGIGGVLIRGEKGTAKSTAARGLADIMPTIQRVAGSRFNCPPDEPLDFCEACQQPDWQVEDVVVPFVNLPLGATEDRVVGSLDLEGVLVERKRKLLPGLLATAHRGILYIDEVNLLPDHLVDVLLDVAAMGVNTVQREGLSISHPARFTLIGTMNPEEGNLRPQFLDRFGLMVDVDAPRDVAERTEVVRRRIAFDTDPAAFAAKWADQQKTLHNQIQAARTLLPSVTLADGLLTLISQLCTDLNVTSLRADIVMYKTALTLAALAGRTDVTADDIRQAAELALVHRQRKKPFEESRLPDTKLDELRQQAPPARQPESQQVLNSPSEPAQEKVNGSPSESDGEPAEPPQQEQVFGVRLQAEVAPISMEPSPFRQQVPVGRRSPVMNPQRGTTMRAVPDKAPTNVAISATVQHALLRDADDWGIIREDLHQNLRIGKTGNLILFVVDASGSMAASRRMEAVKGSVLSLLTDAYQRRDSVGVIAFRGVEAQVLLEPTHSVELAEQAMRTLPTGGRTPLPHALQMASQVISRLNRQQDLQPLLVILSDGKANVALPGGGDAWQQTLAIAAQLREQQIPVLVLDTEHDYLRLGRAAELAKALGADCLSLDELSAEAITQTVSGRIRV
ncbi:putative cobaltochelatase [Spirosoma jeollabukense]